MNYDLNRKCKECNNVDTYKLNKKEAAFDLYDSKEFWNKSCTKCGISKAISIGVQKPDLDQELLDI